MKVRTFAKSLGVAAALIAAVVTALSAPAERLPSKGPVPEPRAAAQPAAPNTEPASGQEPGTLPHPTPRPAEPQPGADAAKPSGEAAPEPSAAPKPEVPPRPPTSPAEEAACRQRLKAMGARFEEEPAQSDPSGCDFPRPLSLTALSSDIAVTPPALVNCATAEAVARFATGTVSRLAKEELGAGLKSISQASGYVCRPRNGTHKLSEHAFGNALDIAAFVLIDGQVVEVTATRNPKQSVFLSKVRDAACGPFKTVLGPGSDADHATHFHVDLAERRSGKPFCQ